MESLSLGAEDIEEEEEGSRRSSRRQAAKNVSYTLDIEDVEYTDSPASSSHSRDTGRLTKTRGRKRGGGGSTRGRGKKGKGGPKVPPMKIKMIGRSGESDSPIFFAESLESWDEGSDSERGEPLRDSKVTRLRGREADSETSSIDFTEVRSPTVHTHYTVLVAVKPSLQYDATLD